MRIKKNKKKLNTPILNSDIVYVFFFFSVLIELQLKCSWCSLLPSCIIGFTRICPTHIRESNDYASRTGVLLLTKRRIIWQAGSKHRKVLQSFRNGSKFYRGRQSASFKLGYSRKTLQRKVSVANSCRLLYRGSLTGLFKGRASQINQ